MQTLIRRFHCDPEVSLCLNDKHSSVRGATRAKERRVHGPRRDMNNFTVAANGVAKTTVVNPCMTLMTGGNSVFVGDGAALVIHAQADDMKSDPAGNAGDRIACGLIVK